MKGEEYIEFLKSFDNFNDKQLEYLKKVREQFLHEQENDDFYYDSWERDICMELNRTGLFEDDDENLTDILHWWPDDVRFYISEV